MEYKGYVASVEFDEQAEIFHGVVQNLRDVITFQGKTVEELKTGFRDSVDDYLDFCAERGEEPEKPYSGRFVLRLGAELHREAATCAIKTGESLNTWACKAVESAIASQTAQENMVAQLNTPGVWTWGNVVTHRHIDGLIVDPYHGLPELQLCSPGKTTISTTLGTAMLEVPEPVHPVFIVGEEPEHVS